MAPVIEVDGVEWVTADEARAQLGDDVTPEMIRAWKHSGRVTGHRVGRTGYYRLDQLLTAERDTRHAQKRPRRVGAGRVSA